VSVRGPIQNFLALRYGRDGEPVGDLLSPGGDEEKNVLGDATLCQAVVYQDIENIMSMKREYEKHKLLRSFQGFDRDYLQKLVLVWLGCEGQGSHPLDSYI